MQICRILAYFPQEPKQEELPQFPALPGILRNETETDLGVYSINCRKLEKMGREEGGNRLV
jgi:hypothetical protein